MACKCNWTNKGKHIRILHTRCEECECQTEDDKQSSIDLYQDVDVKQEERKKIDDWVSAKMAEEAM